MSTTLLYGLILAAANIVLTLVGYFLGYQTEKINEGAWFGFTTVFILFVTVLWLGIRAVREEHPNKELTYGKGVGSGMLIALYGSLLSAAYIYAHFKFINPNYTDYVLEAFHKNAAQTNMPAQAIEMAEKVIPITTMPINQAISVLIFGLISSLIISLITAAFLKQTPPANSVDGT